MNLSNTRVPWHPEKYLAVIPFKDMVDFLGVSTRSLRSQISKGFININSLQALRQRLNPLKEDPNPELNQMVARIGITTRLRIIRTSTTKKQIRDVLGMSGKQINEYLLDNYGTIELLEVQGMLRDSEGVG